MADTTPGGPLDPPNIPITDPNASPLDNPPDPPYDSDAIANALMVSLVGENNAQLPDVDLSREWFEIPWTIDHDVYKEVKRVGPEDITTKEVDGTGIFDVMMAGIRAHLELEYKKNRITGAEYAKTYVALTQAALANAVQFALGKDQAFWTSAKAQAEAITARTANEATKLQVLLGRAEYALTKLKLATEDANFGAQKYNITRILPAQRALLREQMEAQRGQTFDHRSDGQEIKGVVAAQKALYEQQVRAYEEDIRHKFTKLLTDTWLTRHSIDEEIVPPKQMLTRALEEILRQARLAAMGKGVQTDPYDPPSEYEYTDE